MIWVVYFYTEILERLKTAFRGLRIEIENCGEVGQMDLRELL